MVAKSSITGSEIPLGTLTDADGRRRTRSLARHQRRVCGHFPARRIFSLCPVGSSRILALHAPPTHPRDDPMATAADPATADRRPTSLRYYVLAALLVITAINYAQRNCISPAATTIEADLDVSKVKLDSAMSAFFLAYTLLQVPSGRLAKRWGSRLVLPLYATGWSLALALCVLPWGFPALYSGRLLMGAFQAGIFPCCTLVLSVWYPASQRGLAT